MSRDRFIVSVHSCYTFTADIVHESAYEYVHIITF